MPEIKYTNNLHNTWIKSLVYGPSGVGKTYLAGSASKPIVLSAEEGLLSLRKLKIPYIEIRSYKQLVEAVKWLGTKEASNYDTAILDSLSEIAEVVLQNEFKSNADGRKAYGNMQQTMYEMMRYFRDLQTHNVVMLAKQMTVKEGLADKCIPIMPSSALQAQVPYFWDLVLHMHMAMDPTSGITYRAFHTKDSPMWSAKDRSGNLDELEEPNLTKLFIKARS